MHTVLVRDVEIGAGTPKIIVPLTGTSGDELLAQAADAVAFGPDLVEWRVDFLVGAPDPEALVAAARQLVGALAGVPLLATIRTAEEGGQLALTAEAYGEAYLALVRAGVVDLIDLELMRDRAVVTSVIDAAHAAGVAVVASNHDFDATPSHDEIVARLLEMERLGADVLKLAAMPRDPADVLTLLSATHEVRSRSDRPLITMSMGDLGVVSRLAGGVFGSAATFGMVGQASAPGQVEVAELRRALGLVHRGA